MENLNNKALSIIVVITTLLTLCMSVHLTKKEGKINKLNQKIIEQKKEIDSLHDNMFIMNIEINRHELTREFIFEKYPRVGKEYYDYYGHETE